MELKIHTLEFGRGRSLIGLPQVNAEVLEEMKNQKNEFENIPMPFEMKRMDYGGFQVEVEG